MKKNYSQPFADIAMINTLDIMNISGEDDQGIKYGTTGYEDGASMQAMFLS